MSDEYTLPRVMQFLQLEWQRNERDRIQWDIEKAEMKSRIAKLQGDAAAGAREAQSLRKTVEMLQGSNASAAASVSTSGINSSVPVQDGATGDCVTAQPQIHQDLGKLAGARQYLDECVQEVRGLLGKSGISDVEAEVSSASAFGARSRLVKTLTNFRGDPAAICLIIDSLYAVGTDEGTIVVWDMYKATTFQTGSPVVALFLMPTEMRLVAVCQDSVQLYSIEIPSGKLVRLQSVDCPEATAAAYSPQLGQVAVCLAEGSVRTYTASSQSVSPESTTRFFAESTGIVPTMATYDSTRLLIGYNDGGLLQVEPSTSQLIKRLHSPPAQTLLSDGGCGISAIVKVGDQVVITGHRNGELRVFDLARGQPREELMGAHTRQITSLSSSPSGSTIVSTSSDGRVSLWTVNLGNIAWSGRLLSHDAQECGGALISLWTNDNIIAIGGGDGLVRLYSLV